MRDPYAVRPSVILNPPAPDNAYQADHVARLAAAFARVSGDDLYAETGIDPAAPGPSAWHGNFALLSHRGDDQAVLNYGNALVLALWECDWDQLTTMPSARTAPAEDVSERGAMMERVAREGFVRGYRGRRVSRGGRLFMIEDGIVWRLADSAGMDFGVAAFFPSYRLL
jgi:hypothetical protein